MILLIETSVKVAAQAAEALNDNMTCRKLLTQEFSNKWFSQEIDEESDLKDIIIAQFYNADIEADEYEITEEY